MLEFFRLNRKLERQPLPKSRVEVGGTAFPLPPGTPDEERFAAYDAALVAIHDAVTALGTEVDRLGQARRVDKP